MLLSVSRRVGWRGKGPDLYLIYKGFESCSFNHLSLKGTKYTENEINKETQCYKVLYILGFYYCYYAYII